MGCDGVARLFDVRGALGTGSLCGTVLRSRIPRSSGAANVQQSAVHLRSINTATTNYPHTTNNGGHPHTHPSAAVSGSALRVQQVSHFMAHPAERRASLGSPSHAQASQAHMHNSSMHSESNDASFAYDFIIHDSTDEHDAHSKRKPGFRSTSVGRGAGGEGSVTGQRGGFGSSTAKTSTGKGKRSQCHYAVLFSQTSLRNSFMNVIDFEPLSPQAMAVTHGLHRWPPEPLVPSAGPPTAAASPRAECCSPSSPPTSHVRLKRTRPTCLCSSWPP